MNENREQIIQEAGIETANALQQITDELYALRDYLGIVKVYGTMGYKFLKSRATDDYVPPRFMPREWDVMVSLDGEIVESPRSSTDRRPFELKTIRVKEVI